MNKAISISGSAGWRSLFARVLNPDWIFYLAVATLPFETLVQSEIVTIPKIVGVLAFASWLLAVIIQRRAVRWGAPLVLMGLFILWGACSILWTRGFSETRSMIITYFLLTMFYFLTINIVRTRDQLDKMLVALWIGGILVVCSGVFQVATTSWEATLNNQRVAGFIGNPNTYGVWVLATVPGFYWVIARGWKSITGVLAILGLAAMVVTILYSASRGGAIAAAALVLCFLVLNLHNRRNAVIALVVLIVVGLIVWQFAPPLFWTRLSQINETGVGDRLSGLWPAGWSAFLQNPWLGSGLGTNILVISSAIQAEKTIGSLMGVHCAPLAVAIEVGIPGILLYLAFVFYPAFSLLKAILLKRQVPALKGLVPIILASFVAFLVSWVKGGGLEYSKILWLILGLMTATAAIIQSTSSDSGAINNEQDSL